jgi:uncharacterized protein
MQSHTFHLRKIPDTFAICKLQHGDSIPPWAIDGNIWSVTKTPSELSIVCPQVNLPHGLRAERNWRALQVVGPLPFEMVGILASLVGTLADAQISVFALSTFETDFILVRAESLEAACKALLQAGHTIDA